MIKTEELKTQISRAIIRVPDVKPKTGEVSTHEILFTLRPSWSKVGKYETALPGGKIEQGDFEEVDSEAFDDPFYTITLEQMIQAGLHAAEREVLEELGLPLTAGLLTFVDKSTNKAGWTTWAYAADLTEKPTVQVMPDSAGTRWVDEERIINGNPRLLQGHLAVTRRSLKKLK